MIRALWLADTKPPKTYTLQDEEAILIGIKNDELKARLLPKSPELMTIRGAMEWAELVRRVATGYGANSILIDRSMALRPLVLTLQQTLKPYQVTLRLID